jgi:hypothetical protein
MSPDEAYRLLLDVFEGQLVAWELQDLIEGGVLHDEDLAEITARIEQRVIEGEAPAGALQAPRIVNEENRRRYEHNKAEFLREITRCGAYAVGEVAQEMGDPAAFSAFMDACDEFDAKLERALGVCLTPLAFAPPTRARESRPRRRSSRSRSLSRSGDDDGLADLHRRWWWVP